MHRRPAPLLPLLAWIAFACLVPRQATPDVVSWDLERREWSTQVGSSPLVGAFQISSSVTGTGMAETTLTTPASLLLLTGSSIQRAFSTNLTIASSAEAATNLQAVFERAFPQGLHRLTAVIQTTNPITGRVTSRTNSLAVDWTNGFPVTAPAVTNVTPPAPLAATQVFRWPAFGGTDDYASFYVLEGNFDTNLLASLAQQGASALTNLNVRHASPRLPAGPGEITVTNLDTALDHIVWLEFHRTNPENNAALGEVDAVRANLMFHRRAAAPVIVVQPRSQSLTAGTPVSLEVTAIGTALTYQWRRNASPLDGATQATLTLPALTPDTAGSYDVDVSNSSGTVRSEPAEIRIAETPVTLTPTLQLAIPQGSDQPRLTLRGSPDTRYRLERSDNLADWTDHAQLLTDGNGSAETTVRTLGQARFLRAVAP